MTKSSEILFSKPSKVWNRWLELGSFLKTCPDEHLRMHVGFGYNLGSPIEKDLWRVNQNNIGEDKAAIQISNDYKRLISGIDPKYHLSEIDPKFEYYSIPYEDENTTRWINSDVLRMQVNVSNLFRLNLFKKEISICEIGGGYGHLANALMRTNNVNKYLIIDFPQVLDVVNRWILNTKPDFKVFLYKNIEDFDSNNKTQGLHLLSNELFFSLKHKVDYNLGINVNSFDEMTTNQVENYINGEKLIMDILYSNNQSIQPNNSELIPLTHIFKKYANITPDYSVQINEGVKFKKYIHLLYFNKNETFQEINIDDLTGIKGTKMPALGF